MTVVKTYHEIRGSRHYEYRVEENDRLTDWVDAGPAGDGSEHDELLAHLKATLAGFTYWEIRVVVSVADDASNYAGILTLTERIEGGTEYEPGAR